MRAVVSDLLLETVAAICRTFARNESHILLAGPTGSMKFDALHLACTHLGIKMITITPVKNYSINDFYNDLKTVIEQWANRTTHFHSFSTFRHYTSYSNLTGNAIGCT